MKRIRICHVIDASTYNRLLYNSLKFSDRDKFEYVVISLAPRGILHKQMEELGIASFAMNCVSRRQYASTIVRLARTMRRQKFNIVQVHSFEGSVVGLIAARLANVPVRIFSGHHSHEIPLYNSKRLLMFDGFFSKRLATNIMAWSANMKEIFVKAFGALESRVSIIHHGMDLEKWFLESQRTAGLREELGLVNKTILGTVGRLFWVKDLERLIDVFASIAEGRDDLALVIVGEGEDRPKLEHVIESKHLRSKVFLTGKRDDIAVVMNSFDVYVHTALAESFGLVLIEALALGKPIVTSRVGIAEEVITEGENGFLFEAGNSAGLRSALESALDERTRWGEMGGKNQDIAKRFAIQATQEKCDRFYASLVEGL